MIAKRMLLLSAAGSMLLLAACQTAQDVPVPEDEQAKEWTGPIKTAYPEWQPTKEMPKGNAEYDAVFVAAAAKNTPVAEPVADPVDLAAVQEENTEKEQYPILYAPCPDKVRLDVAENGDFLVNGSVLPADIVEKYLKKIVAAHKEKSAAIIYLQNVKSPMDKANELLEVCRKANVANVTFVEPKAEVKKPAAKKPVVKKPAKKKAVKMVIDTNKPGTAYVVKKDDTLGGLARKFYGRASLAGLIFEHNRNTVKDIHKIMPGMKIVIPALKEAE